MILAIVKVTTLLCCLVLGLFQSSICSSHRSPPFSHIGFKARVYCISFFIFDLCYSRPAKISDFVSVSNIVVSPVSHCSWLHGGPWIEAVFAFWKFHEAKARFSSSSSPNDHVRGLVAERNVFHQYHNHIYCNYNNKPQLKSQTMPLFNVKDLSVLAICNPEWVP